MHLGDCLIRFLEVRHLVMRGKYLRNIRNHVGKNGGGTTQCAVNPLLLDFMSGDIVWVKVHNSSWWPAQVVDEKTVPEGHITNKKMADEVLVRLYGGYDFLYVDPTKYYSEFENMLKQNNGNFRAIIKKALKQDRAQLEYDDELEEEMSESKDEARVIVSDDKKPEQDQIKIKKNCEVDNVGATVVCNPPKKDEIIENHKPNGLGSRGASSGKPGGVSSRRKRATRRNLSAEESVGEEASTVITPKQNQVSENHRVESPIIDLSERESLAKVQAGVSGSRGKTKVEASKDKQAKKDRKIKKNCESKDEQAKKDEKIKKNCDSKDKRPKNDGIKMKNKDHEADNSGPVSMVCEKSKQDEIKEKQEMDGLSPSGASLGKPQDASALRTRVSKRHLSSDNSVVEKAPKAKTPKKNRVIEQNKADSPSIEKGSLETPQDTSLPRTRVLKRHLFSDKSVVEEAPKANTPKKTRVNEHNKADSPSIERGSLETPQDTSLRRTRVMQNLGLIAPSGSPFRRNGV